MYIVPFDRDSYQSINQHLLWLSLLNAGWSVWENYQRLLLTDWLWIGGLLAGYTILIGWLRTQSFYRRRLVIDGLLIALSIVIGIMGTLLFISLSAIGLPWPWLRQISGIVGLLLWQQWRMISTEAR
ncbi:hypothetical protein [Herpetosiphon giganteus]|uniref:hypothetical protein n=1 Tax=Herpetosiphon giganteus TaxID=2029754 RepID=UPI0019569B92|nr:hypothetical protein [Herpetosiphon giganteus]MBM7841498.1 hypothetical protein [Herpetosiphon giganteus]